MRTILRLPILAALPLILTACQTYEATYVETPRVRRTVVVEQGYDPYYEPRPVFAPRPVYRDPFYDPFRDDYRERRYYRERSYGYDRPIYRGPVTQPGVPSGPVLSGPVRRYEPAPGTSGPVRRLAPGEVPPGGGVRVPVQRID
jgi:hypothetical protein